MKSDDEIYAMFEPLWGDIVHPETFPQKRPLLAHYTSIPTLERVMANDEVWFSNPLYMNDMEELRFGILEGAQAFRRNADVKAVCDSAKYELLTEEFEKLFEQFSNKTAFDIYVFCLSEHEPTNSDGLLSMWRAYGGNGSGAAVVIDTSVLEFVTDSPLIISKVTYESREQRLKWIESKLAEFAQLLRSSDVPNDKLFLPLRSLFERFKMNALFTKHHGFSEEREWRMVYLRERDHGEKMSQMLHYAIGRNGVEPKLKLKVRPIDGLSSQDLSLERIVSKIVLGPSMSGPLAVNAVKRMLEKVGKSEIAQRTVGSSTPFRPTP